MENVEGGDCRNFRSLFRSLSSSLVYVLLLLLLLTADDTALRWQMTTPTLATKTFVVNNAHRSVCTSNFARQALLLCDTRDSLRCSLFSGESVRFSTSEHDVHRDDGVQQHELTQFTAIFRINRRLSGNITHQEVRFYYLIT